MDTKLLIELLGGPSAVMADTGLSKGRISQWVIANKIPRPWLKFYLLKRPEIPWSEYEGNEPIPTEVEIAPRIPLTPRSNKDRRAADRRERDRRATERRDADRRTKT